jgi:hypothetical protein
VALAGEGCGEAWLPHLDLMLALQVSRERYASLPDPWQVIPLFQAVYHPYAVVFGSYSSLVAPPYDELWPARFAPEEPLALLDRKFARQFTLEQARGFVWGQQPMLANFRPQLLAVRSEEMDYLVRLARVRARALKYLLRGEFLRPPELDAPVATLDFSRLSIYAGQKDRVRLHTRRHPLALAAAWRGADGDVGIALASIAGEPLAVSLKLDLAAYGLAQPVRAHRIDQHGRRPVAMPAGTAPVLELTLAPRDAWLLELSNRSPRSGDRKLGLAAPSGAPLRGEEDQ